MFVLSQESIQQTLKNYTGKRRRSDLFFSVFIGFLCAIFLNLILFNGGYDFTNIFVLLIHVITPLVVFGMIRVGTILNRTKIKNSPYIILRAKITGCICTPPIDSGSDNYYFVFDCTDYGSMLYEVSSYAYDSAVVDVDEYYLVVVKRRFSKKYEIVKIFSTEQYELSPALEKLFG